MSNGFRFRCYPTKEQEQVLLRWIGCQRLIYNAKVSEDRYFRAFKRRFVGLAGVPIPVDQTYSQFITETTEFLREVPSQILRNGAALWRQAYARYFQGLGGRPKYKRKGGRQKVWITSELFTFVPRKEGGYRLLLGTKKFPVGELAYVAHREHPVPASIHLSVEGGRWYVSFSAEEPGQKEGAQDTLEEAITARLRELPRDDLLARTCGCDRGVAKPLVISEGQVYDLLPVQKSRIEKGRRRQKRWQRRASRRQKGSRNQQKAYRKVARYGAYEANVRMDFSHKVSHALVANERFDLYVFEDLKIQNMTRRPKAKQDVQGRYVRNGAKAKAGLNRAILSSSWGQVVKYTTYKALRAGKLVIKIPPEYSSQECAECGHTEQGNRPSHAEFVCRRCGHTDDADHNASVVTARREIEKLLSGEPLRKPRKKPGSFDP